jgi:hypothetical protein
MSSTLAFMDDLNLIGNIEKNSKNSYEDLKTAAMVSIRNSG